MWIPDKKLWAEWTPLEKWTFLAQILVPVSLLVTVVFSYLSWHEARAAGEQAKAAQLQERAFWIAQNPPQLELTGGQMLDSTVGPMLFLYMKNEGDSAARSPCAEIHSLTFKPDYQEHLLTTNCTPENPYANAMLRKGEGVTYNFPQQGYLQFNPSIIRIWRPDEPHKVEKCSRRSEMLLVALRFTDVAGQAYRNVRQVQLCE
jgi:hypothetical protein